MQPSFKAEPDIKPENIVMALLEEAGITQPPTDAELIAQYLELSLVDFDESWGLSPKIRAYLWPERREIGLYKGLSPRRRTFSTLHEVGHYVIPGHVRQPSERIEDTDKDLSSTSVITREREANRFAADCLFQLSNFDQKIINTSLSWTNILLLADLYLASYEATARRWVERTNEECALIVFKPVTRPSFDADLEIMYTITSTTFREKYFYSLKPGQTIDSDSLTYRVFYHLEYREDPEEILTVETPTVNWEFRMRLFSNSYRMFGLLTPIIK